jgi:hypothetical protein
MMKVKKEGNINSLQEPVDKESNLTEAVKWIITFFEGLKIN